MPKATLEERLAKIDRQRAPQQQPIADTALTAEVEQVSQERDKLLALAEKICFARCESIPADKWHGSIREYFTAAELAVFDGLAWNKQLIGREINRARGIIRWQGVAGTADDRRMADQRQADAQAVLAERGPEIERQVETLQRELRGLQREVHQSTADVEARQRAVTTLREFAPVSAREEHGRRLAALAPLRREVSEIRGRLQRVAVIGAIDVRGLDGGQQARLVAEAQRPEIARDAAQGFVCRAGWSRFVAELQQEIEPLETKAAELQEQLEAGQLEADATLDCYSR